MEKGDRDLTHSYSVLLIAQVRRTLLMCLRLCINAAQVRVAWMRAERPTVRANPFIIIMCSYTYTVLVRTLSIVII